MAYPWADEPEYNPDDWDGPPDETDPELYAHLAWGDDGLPEPAIQERAAAVQVNLDHPLAAGLVMAAGPGWQWEPHLGRLGLCFDGTAPGVHTN